MKGRCLTSFGLFMVMFAIMAGQVSAASPVYGNTVLIYRNADGTSVVLGAVPGTPKDAISQAAIDAQAAGWVPRLRISVTGRGGASAATSGTVTPQTVGSVGKNTCTWLWSLFTLQGNCVLSAYTNDYETPPGGSRDRIETAFTSTISHTTLAGLTTNVTFIRSDSWTLWWGTNPYNANEVCLSDLWEATGWAFTGVSVTWPAGLGFSASGSSLRWHCPSTLANTDRLEHITSGVRFSGVDINGIQETATEDMRFGSVWYTSYNATNGVH